MKDNVKHYNSILVEKLKNTVKFNKPMQIGCTILELSKLYMYQFYKGVIVEVKIKLWL